MAGAQFEYDERGGTFYYFVVSFYALVLLPVTYFFLRSKTTDDQKDEKNSCHCKGCEEKEEIKEKGGNWRKIKRYLSAIVLVIAWIGLGLLIWKVLQIKIEHVEYDPYGILELDRGATDRDVKRQYRKLSLLHHPDKGGDPKRFVAIAKAYEALTNEEVKENWEKYGNPDGPSAMTFGIALPKWIVEKENSLLVLGVYCFAFMVVLPTVVGIWWYRSIKYSADQVLLKTTELFSYFFYRTPGMVTKRAIMVLSASLEFDKSSNKEVVLRPSDDIEVPNLIKQLPMDFKEKIKQRPPFCYPYCVKARALIYAHLSRLPLPEKTLDVDRRFILKRSPLLVNEMVNVMWQLTMYYMAGQIRHFPRVETLENVMKVSAMLVQAVWDGKGPLLQLPHITEDILKHFVTKKRRVKTCADLAALPDDERKSLLRSLNHIQYENVLRVLASMPRVTLAVRWEVQDDEDKHNVTVNAVITVFVHLKRAPLSVSSVDSSQSLNDGGRLECNVEDEDNQQQNGSEEENNVENIDDGNESKQLLKKPQKLWGKNKKKKGGGGKPKKKPQKGQDRIIMKVIPAPGEEKAEEESSPSKKTKSRRQNDDSQEANESENENDGDNEDGASTSEAEEVAENIASDQLQDESDDEADQDFRFNAEMAKKERKLLEGKTNLTHPVHCPYFPEEKQEWWWVYICDRKTHQLLAAPYHVTTLVKEEEVELKFPAPPKVGNYQFQVCLRSDSYLDQDQSQDFKFQVHEAKEIKSHPQWDFEEDEEKEKSESDASDASEYTEESEPENI